MRELGDGWFRLLTWKDGAGSTGVWAWVSTHAGDEAAVKQFKDRAQEALERLFPST